MLKLHRLNYFMGVAEAVSKASPDLQTRVGAILINNDTNAIIATGFNGFVRKAPDHLLPKTRPDKYKYFIHAEANLIYHCAKHGISMENTTLICTLSPCENCMRSLWQCGVTTVVCKDLYKDHEANKNLLDINVEVEKYEDLHILKFTAKEDKCPKILRKSINLVKSTNEKVSYLKQLFGLTKAK